MPADTAPDLARVSDDALSAFLHAALFGRDLIFDHPVTREMEDGDRGTLMLFEGDDEAELLASIYTERGTCYREDDWIEFAGSLVTPSRALDALDRLHMGPEVQRAERPAWHAEDWGRDAVGRWFGALRSDHGDRVEIWPDGRYREFGRFVAELVALALIPSASPEALSLLAPSDDAAD